MSDRATPLGDALVPGLYGNLAAAPGVTLSETFFDCVSELAAFDGQEPALAATLAKAHGRVKASFSFHVAKSRWLAAGTHEFREFIHRQAAPDKWSFIDLTHGRAALRVSGPKAEWVLSKLFAVDFREAAFPARSGLATMHHDIFAQIHRSDARTFDIFVYRSFARAFWHTLCRAAEEVGYEAA